jgi:hypothetical protein
MPAYNRNFNLMGLWRWCSFLNYRVVNRILESSRGNRCWPMRCATVGGFVGAFVTLLSNHNEALCQEGLFPKKDIRIRIISLRNLILLSSGHFCNYSKIGFRWTIPSTKGGSLVDCLEGLIF